MQPVTSALVTRPDGIPTTRSDRPRVLPSTSTSVVKTTNQMLIKLDTLKDRYLKLLMEVADRETSMLHSKDESVSAWIEIQLIKPPEVPGERLLTKFNIIKNMLIADPVLTSDTALKVHTILLPLIELKWIPQGMKNKLFYPINGITVWLNSKKTEADKQRYIENLNFEVKGSLLPPKKTKAVRELDLYS